MLVVEEEVAEVAHELWRLHAGEDRHQQTVVRRLYVCNFDPRADASGRKVRMHNVLGNVAYDMVTATDAEYEGGSVRRKVLSGDLIPGGHGTVLEYADRSVEALHIGVAAHLLIGAVVDTEVAQNHLVHHLIEVTAVGGKGEVKVA